MIKITPEEREAMDRAAEIRSIPHYMAELVDYDTGKMDWETFEKDRPELYDTYCNLTVDEIDDCLSEAYKIGAVLPGYGEVINILNKHRDDTERAMRPLFY